MANATPLRLWITAVALVVACAALGGRPGRATTPAAKAQAPAAAASVVALGDAAGRRVPAQ